jgi:hypothetical protein
MTCLRMVYENCRNGDCLFSRGLDRATCSLECLGLPIYRQTLDYSLPNRVVSGASQYTYLPTELFKISDIKWSLTG